MLWRIVLIENPLHSSWNINPSLTEALTSWIHPHMWYWQRQISDICLDKKNVRHLSWQACYPCHLTHVSQSVSITAPLNTQHCVKESTGLGKKCSFSHTRCLTCWQRARTSYSMGSCFESSGIYTEAGDNVLGILSYIWSSHWLICYEPLFIIVL